MSDRGGRSALATPRKPAGLETHYASVREMAEWFASAAPGHEMIYATGAALDPRHDAPFLAAKWARDGRALPFKRRDPGDQVLRHWLRKLAPAVVVAAAVEPAVVLLDPESDEGRVYRLLARCANLARACPSNEAVAEAAKLSDRKRASYLIGKLADLGLIRIEAAAKLGPRVVRIVASGKCTAERET